VRLFKPLRVARVNQKYDAAGSAVQLLPHGARPVPRAASEVLAM